MADIHSQHSDIEPDQNSPQFGPNHEQQDRYPDYRLDIGLPASTLFDALSVTSRGSGPIHRIAVERVQNAVGNRGVQRVVRWHVEQAAHERNASLSHKSRLAVQRMMGGPYESGSDES